MTWTSMARWRSLAPRVALSAGLLTLAASPGPTEAFTISTLFTSGCHERLTSEALRAVRLEVVAAGPLSLTADERALVEDLEFTPNPDMRDLGAATLLVGVRDNDLKGRASDDLTLLATVHGDPNNQDEHCLRSQSQDEPTGSAAALADCRTFIRGRVVEALAGLDATGAPDPSRRTSLPLHLSLRGSIDASLPTYYVRIGQAMHAIQDSFSHTYRTLDGMEITVILNWIDEANGTLVESRDGPGHASALDVCDDPDALRTTRRTLATEASALLRATLGPATSPDQKLAAVDALLDTYLGDSPGCTYDNAWCAAPEAQYKDKPAKLLGGCSSGGGGEALAGVGVLLALAVRPRRRASLGALLAPLACLVALALPAGRAQAEPADPAPATEAPDAQPAVGEPNAPPAPVVVPVVQPGPRDPNEGAWGGYLGLAGSVDKPAAAIQLGLRRKLSSHWTVGWDVEWNPWVSLYGPNTVRAGVASTYGTVILRFPLAYEAFNLRTTLNLGASYLLFDLYGAPKGSIGLYGAISPLGVEWKVSRLFFLILNPISIAVPVPQLHGVPLTYPQYRATLGLGILAG
jgi:uncharacterized protein (TIGR03382 family)